MTDSERIAEDSDMESIEDGDNNRVSNIIMNRPDLLAALQNRFQIANVIQNLPAPVKRRVKALKQLQLAQVNIEAKFYEEVHALECKYNKMCVELHDKRSNIVSGIYEPTDEEAVWETDNEEDDIANDIKEKVKIEEVKDNDEKETDNVKGIPDFWLTIFKNVAMLDEMVQEHDEAILKHLYDIKVIFLESDPMGFILEFHFEPNEYFSNSVLTKEYLMKCAPEKNDPFSFEGPEIHKSKGCTIDWKKGKNVTVKTIKKNQKHKSRGHVRTVTKTVQNDSFFNFFTPPVVPDDTEVDLDEEMKALLTSDFEIGHYIRERIVPRAVLYYTGKNFDLKTIKFFYIFTKF
ncbi:Similar to Nap1l4: Nucleosome assembly protein 1-like 4 (Mus musculus) [Cotesia congregata]|uniref:Similar to Nap1l4: Nucleosome assembly protein 1-like 4 (Mus musculus) n=1 Tax=Cotesia congregata TaxID=51543 RepID=A0A8J2GZY9_COTCN|nr:Similar to Nap1l4: Nucleosome assembly protein 1-like 4 (Mus musculus) [Cotesia congregata]